LDEINLDLVKSLQKLRDKLGHVVTITSGLRCPTKNKIEGGHVRSKHLSGDAADFVVGGIPLLDVYRYVIQIRELLLGGVGLYPPWTDETGKRRANFIHVNIGPQARWGKIRGNQCSLITAVETLKRQETRHVLVDDSSVRNRSSGSGCGPDADGPKTD
jgi:hypothetical protein